jgi:hypothetical protein
MREAVFSLPTRCTLGAEQVPRLCPEHKRRCLLKIVLTYGDLGLGTLAWDEGAVQKQYSGVPSAAIHSLCGRCADVLSVLESRRPAEASLRVLRPRSWHSDLCSSNRMTESLRTSLSEWALWLVRWPRTMWRSQQNELDNRLVDSHGYNCSPTTAASCPETMRTIRRPDQIVVITRSHSKSAQRVPRHELTVHLTLNKV